MEGCCARRPLRSILILKISNSKRRFSQFSLALDIFVCPHATLKAWHSPSSSTLRAPASMSLPSLLTLLLRCQPSRDLVSAPGLVVLCLLIVKGFAKGLLTPPHTLLTPVSMVVIYTWSDSTISLTDCTVQDTSSVKRGVPRHRC